MNNDHHVFDLVASDRIFLVVLISRVYELIAILFLIWTCFVDDDDDFSVLSLPLPLRSRVLKCKQIIANKRYIDLLRIYLYYTQLHAGRASKRQMQSETIDVPRHSIDSFP